ncbi:TlpA family protein disulfide reductase [Formosa haliotis]|uniref:TlpA family protein disulfide reductase n=1 Tax=Formosa haliotis TaxID=1555194 RepID=UPI00082709D1|nr:TlpA disulfide reductase family protein [Formosa haliotis]
MKLSKSQRSNIVFLGFILLLIIPQTRTPIQIFLQKGLALFGPSVTQKENQKQLDSYHWKLVDLNGNSYDFRTAEGKVVLINFWATWCPPCIAEMPHLVDLYNDYHNKIEFLFVSNEDQAVIKAFLNKHQYDIPVHQSRSTVPDQLNTTGIPRALLINKEGSIVIDKTGAANWNSDSVRETINRLILE